MQLNGSAKCSGSKAQSIALRSAPGTPFDDCDATADKKLLSDLPLQNLNPSAPLFIVEIKAKTVHPLVRRETNGAESAFECLGQCGLTRTWQSANNNQSWSVRTHWHKRLLPRNGLRGVASLPASRNYAPSRAEAGTALVRAQPRRAAISSARVVESGTVCASASRSNCVESGFFSEYAA